jgi:hypothetical protein
MMQTIVLDQPVAMFDTGRFILSALDEEHAQDLLDLYQLAITLLGCSAPQEVIQASLEVLKDKLRSSIAGFLWLSDEGVLKPQIVLPESGARNVHLSRSLTELVIEKRHAVWVSDHPAVTASSSISHFADAICVPLLYGVSRCSRRITGGWQRNPAPSTN